MRPNFVAPGPEQRSGSSSVDTLAVDETPDWARQVSGLPVMQFDPASVAPEQEFEVFHDTTAPLFATSPIDDVSTFRMRATDYLVDDLLVCRLETGAHTLRRSTQHLADGATDWISVEIHHRGRVRGEAGRDTSVDLGPDRIGILDFSKTIATWSSGGPSTWVGLPRSRVEHADRLGAIRTIESSSLRGQVLQSAVTDLCAQLPSAAATDAADLAAGIADTVNRALDPDGYTPSDNDLRVAMESYIQEHLTDLDLGVDQLRAGFHCSRSSVYRAFEPNGGVAHYVREQRLLRCFHELSRPTKMPRRVGDVATRWGFENPSHFNRMFKSKFGLPPSALLGAAGEPADATHQPDLANQIEHFRSWAASA